MSRALLIPVSGPVQEVQLDGTLQQLQQLVGGFVEANPLPQFVDPDDRATCYTHAQGKAECEPNMRATDFMVPGVGLFMGDYVAGPFIVCGFNPATGTNEDVPARVEKRVRLIENEAGS